jgi:hypothetical protein
VSEALWQVRLWDMMDGTWVDVGDPMPRAEAEQNAKDRNEEKYGKPNAGFNDGDYYAVFPSDTKLHWSDGRMMFR